MYASEVLHRCKYPLSAKIVIVEQDLYTKPVHAQYVVSDLCAGEVSETAHRKTMPAYAAQAAHRPVLTRTDSWLALQHRPGDTDETSLETLQALAPHCHVPAPDSLFRLGQYTSCEAAGSLLPE